MSHTQQSLAQTLDHLDPGCLLAVEPAVLERIFGAGRPLETVFEAVERFAEEHRCTFTSQGHDRALPEFTKDDVF